MEQALFNFPYHIALPDGRGFDYFVAQSARRRSLSIVVQPDGEVLVKTPIHINSQEVETFVRRNAEWVLARLRDNARRPQAAAPVRFADGERVSYLGVPHALRIRGGLPVRAARNGETLEITLHLIPPANKPHEAAECLTQWFTQEAARLFPGRIEHCRELAAREGLPAITRLTLRAMSSRWGSCSATGHITLNPMLLQAPLECADYVAMHELCHLRELNHSPRFYSLLGRCMPDWRKYREQLQAFPPCFRVK